MRPQTQQLAGRAPLQAGMTQGPTLQIRTAPAPLAIDDTRSSELETLKQQLGVFNAGLSANAQLEDRLEQEQAGRDALRDHSMDPTASQYDPSTASGYYHQARMKLFGERAGLDVQLAAEREMERLQANPEELKTIDVAAHMDKFLSSQYQGLADNTALERVMYYAERTRERAVAALSDAQVKAIKEEHTERTWGLLVDSFNLGGEAAATMTERVFKDLRGLVPEEELLAMNYTLVADKVANAANADEAEQWLAMLDRPIEGIGSMAELGNKTSPELMQSVTRVRSTVQQMRAVEEANAAKAEAEAAKEAARAQKERRDRNYSMINDMMGTVRTQDDMAALIAEVQTLDLEDEQLQALRWKSAMKSVELEVRKREGLAEVDGVKGAFDELVAAQDIDSASQFALSEYKRFAESNDPYKARDFMQGILKGSALMEMNYSEDGQLVVSDQLKARIRIFDTLQKENRLASAGIPPEDFAFLQGVSSRLSMGEPLPEAIRNAHAAIQEGTPKLAPEDAETAIASRAKSLITSSKPFTATNRRASEWYAGWARQMLPGLRPANRKEAEAALENLEARQILKVGSGLHRFKDDSLIFLGDNPTYQTKDEFGRTVTQPINRRDVERGAKILIDELEEAGASDVFISPVGWSGMHQITYEEADRVVSTMVPVSEINELAMSIQRARAKDYAKAYEGTLARLGGVARKVTEGPVGLFTDDNVETPETDEAIKDILLKVHEKALRQNATTEVRSAQALLSDAAAKQAQVKGRDALIDYSRAFTTKKGGTN